MTHAESTHGRNNMLHAAELPDEMDAPRMTEPCSPTSVAAIE